MGLRVALGVLAILGSEAAADVTLEDPAIEVAAQYTFAPISHGSHATFTATGIHVIDRNGLYTALISAFANSRCSGDGCSQTINWTSVEDHGSFLILRPQSYTTTEESPEARARREAAGREVGLASNSYTELAVFLPYGETSNVTGGAFGMGGAMFGNARFAVDIGLRWSNIRADVCGAADERARCRVKFFGVPLTVLAKVGRFGGELAYDWNMREDSSVVRASISLDLHDRLFVRAGASAAREAIGDLGYSLELGGRL